MGQSVSTEDRQRSWGNCGKQRKTEEIRGRQPGMAGTREGGRTGDGGTRGEGGTTVEGAG